MINVTEAPAEEVILLQGVNRDMSLFSNRLILRSHMSLSNGPGCWDEQTPFLGDALNRFFPIRPGSDSEL